jgi:hypothetical protein
MIVSRAPARLLKIFLFPLLFQQLAGSFLQSVTMAMALATGSRPGVVERSRGSHPGRAASLKNAAILEFRRLAEFAGKLKFECSMKLISVRG